MYKVSYTFEENVHLPFPDIFHYSTQRRVILLGLLLNLLYIKKKDPMDKFALELQDNRDNAKHYRSYWSWEGLGD